MDVEGDFKVTHRAFLSLKFLLQYKNYIDYISIIYIDYILIIIYII